MGRSPAAPSPMDRILAPAHMSSHWIPRLLAPTFLLACLEAAPALGESTPHRTPEPIQSLPLVSAPPPGRLEITAPVPEKPIGGAPEVLVTGRASFDGRVSGLDVVLVLDVSESMGRPSGFDLDGDGRLGRGGTAALYGGVDRDDALSQLALAGARKLLTELDPGRDRVALGASPMRARVRSSHR